MKIAFSGIITALLVMLVIAVSPAQVITIDPNTTEATAVAEESQDFWSDNRLEQHINYEAKTKPVRDILDELTEIAGVKLNAGYNLNDWQVRDRRMVIIAKDLPLKNLMQSIARVMKFQWSRSEKDGVWTYRLWMDRKMLLGEEAQRYREEQRENDYIDRQRANLITLMLRSSQFTEEELAEMKGSDPYSYAVVKSGAGAAMADLMKAVPEVRHALLSGEELEISGEGMSAQGQEALLRLAKAAGKLEFYQASEKFNSTLADVSGYPERVFARFNDEISRLDPGEPLRRCLLSCLRVSCSEPPDSDGAISGSVSCGMMLLNPDSSVGKSYGKLANRVIDGEASAESTKTELENQTAQLIMTERSDNDWGEPLAEHPEDADLERVVKFELPKVKRSDGTEYEQKCYEDFLGSIAKAAGMSIVSDYFDQPMDFVSPLGSWNSEGRIVDALDFVEGSYITNWWRYGGVVDVRDRYWFRKRAAQVPDEWIERWIGELKKTGLIEIDNFAQICSLTEEQFNHYFRDSYWIENLSSVYQQKNLNAALRFYSSLTKYQKGALMQGGLDTRSLSQVQWEKLGLVDAKLQPGSVVSIFAQRYDYQLPQVDDKGKEVSREREVGCTFTGLAADGSKVLDISVPLPVKWERKSKT